MQQALRTDLEDILGNLHFARRREDLGRLAVLTYWEVRRWARVAREEVIATHARDVITEQPHATRAQFLATVDRVIEELEGIRARHCTSDELELEAA